ncbi:MAG: hypothetical protein V3V47_00430 [Desulfobacteria bacterium]
MAEKKPGTRKPPFEIDKVAIARLRKRIETVREARTQEAVKGGMAATGLESLGKSYHEALQNLEKMRCYLTDILSPPPDGSDE